MATKVIKNNNSSNYNNRLEQAMDWVSAAETAMDATSLYGPASIWASPTAGVLGMIRAGLSYANNNQSGWGAAADAANSFGWGVLGMIPETKVLKLGKAANKTKKVSTSEKTTQELLTAWQNAEAKLRNAGKGSKKALKEEAKQAETAYKQALKASGDTSPMFTKLKPVGRVVGKTATSGAITYGVPGTVHYIENNSDNSFTPGSIIRGIGYGAIGNGFSLLGQDFSKALQQGDWESGARLTNTFLFPNAKIIKGKEVVPPKKSQTPRTRKKTTTQKKPTSNTVEQTKPKVDYGSQPEIPGRKNGGKLNTLKNLRYENNT